MPTTAHMEQAAAGYARLFAAGDREAWLGLFVENPEIIEPADAAPRGREALEEAFANTVGAGLKVELTPHRIIANGNEAAMHMGIRVGLPDGTVIETSAIEIYTFTEDGRIARMRAFLDMPG